MTPSAKVFKISWIKYINLFKNKNLSTFNLLMLITIYNNSKNILLRMPNLFSHSEINLSPKIYSFSNSQPKNYS